MSYLSEHEVAVDLGVDITSIKDRNTKKIEEKLKYSEEEILKEFFNKYELTPYIDIFKKEKVFSFESIKSLV